MSRLGNYSEPDYWPVHRIRDAGIAGRFPVDLVLKDAACPATAILLSALGDVLIQAE